MFGIEFLNIWKYFLYYSKYLIINILFKYLVVYDIILGKLVIFLGLYCYCIFYVIFYYMYILVG